MSPRKSESLHDDAWDAFLQGTQLGHFQQSAMWARYKSAEGWHPERVLLSDDDGPLAGFQLLWRPTRLGRIGYVSKGPVAGAAADAPWGQLTGEIIDVANRLNLQAVIVQPPDWAPAAVPVLRKYGFTDNHFYDVIRATWMIDLSPGWEVISGRFRHGVRDSIRQIKRDGFTIREGTNADLPDFFRMLSAMCSRLGTYPNPGSEGLLEALWTSFHQQGLARILLATHDCESCAGLLLLKFGSRITAWKQASASTGARRRPDSLVWSEAIRTAIDSGCRWFDFAALNVEAARVLENGGDLSRDRRFSRDFFHIGFGGQALRLPDPLVWFRSPVLRSTYGLAIRLPGFIRIKRFLQNGIGPRLCRRPAAATYALSSAAEQSKHKGIE